MRLQRPDAGRSRRSGTIRRLASLGRPRVMVRLALSSSIATRPRSDILCAELESAKRVAHGSLAGAGHRADVSGLLFGATEECRLRKLVCNHRVQMCRDQIL